MDNSQTNPGLPYEVMSLEGLPEAVKVLYVPSPVTGQQDRHVLNVDLSTLPTQETLDQKAAKKEVEAKAIDTRMKTAQRMALKLGVDPSPKKMSEALKTLMEAIVVTKDEDGNDKIHFIDAESGIKLIDINSQPCSEAEVVSRNLLKIGTELRLPEEAPPVDPVQAQWEGATVYKAPARDVILPYELQSNFQEVEAARLQAEKQGGELLYAPKPDAAAMRPNASNGDVFLTHAEMCDLPTYERAKGLAAQQGGVVRQVGRDMSASEHRELRFAQDDAIRAGLINKNISGGGK